MKVLYTYRPIDTSVTITASPALSGFTTANLINIKPSLVYKTLDASGVKYIKYDAGYGNKFNVNACFLNRFNFADFKIQGSDDDFASTPFELSVTGCTRDEIHDDNTNSIVADNYMHYWADLVGFDHRYLRLQIPAQTPLFETGYFKIGNLLIGTATEIWNPKSGFSVSCLPMMNQIDFDSGYHSVYKKGKTYRVFEGQFDKITITEFNKIVHSYNPIVLYLDWTTDNSQAFLVRAMREYRRSYDMADIVNFDFGFREIV
jgi:hypothetical protein